MGSGARAKLCFAAVPRERYAPSTDHGEETPEPSPPLCGTVNSVSHPTEDQVSFQTEEPETPDYPEPWVKEFLDQELAKFDTLSGRQPPSARLPQGTTSHTLHRFRSTEANQTMDGQGHPPTPAPAPQDTAWMYGAVDELLQALHGAGQASRFPATASPTPSGHGLYPSRTSPSTPTTWSPSIPAPAGHDHSLWKSPTTAAMTRRGVNADDHAELRPSSARGMPPLVPRHIGPIGPQRLPPEVAHRGDRGWIFAATRPGPSHHQSQPQRTGCYTRESYADMLRIVKTEPSLQGLKEGVQGLRRAANGGLLVRMQKSLDPSTQQLQAALKTAISGKAEVTVMQETVQVEIRDLDDLTSGEEVTMALFAGEDCDIPSDTAPRMRKAFGGTQIATVSLRPEHARRLLEKGKIRIGWVVCRIREKLEPRRCYKCMGFGHTSARCRASEATAKATQEACFKCGGTGHKHYTSAQDLLTQTVSEQNIDVAILSEPYRPKPEGVWQQSTNGGAAIWSCGQPPCHLAQRATRPGYARAKFQGTTIYSCYLAPSLHTDEFREIVQEIAQDARGRSPVIIAGDFNAWSTAWGDKSGRESYIDLTFASPELTRNSYWEVTHLLTYSDHAAIVFQTRQNQLHQTSRETAYRVHTLNSEVLLSCMDANTITGEANTCADVISARIKAACDAAMEKSTKGGGRRPVPWWNQEIASARSKCLAARRKCQRSRGRTTQELYESRYREMKKALKVAIRTSKHKCFQELCDAADKEPFGSAYKMVTGKLTRQPTPTSQQHLGTIVDTLFPPQPPLRLPSVAAGEPIPTCEEEVLSALTSCQASKAPGPDGIPNAALHAIVKAYPKLFVQLYNTCIAEKTFPRAWKQQRLVLIPKPGKLNDDPSSFRPLCMLNTIGKIFERIIGNKLEREIEERGALSTHQHGFRKKRSTIDAIREVTQLAEKAIEGERWQGRSKKYCLVCTLDVKNAFNSANWSLILQALQRGGISGYIIQLIADYFKDRVLLYSSDAGKQIHHVTGGVPQGSVLGPLLWNVMYDDILRLPLPEDILMSWLADNGLSLAEQKTEAVLISSRKIVEKVNFRVGSTTIESSPTVKYLGVLIDHRLNYKCHLEYSAAKASKATAAISRMMANTRGPRQHSRRLISTVVTSTLLYAAPIWSEAMLVASYSRQCRTVYRRCALRISSCFCTVSEEAALVVAGSIPIDLLAAERRTGNSGSRTQRSTTVARWQARWDNASTGRWTHRLIPDLDQWIHRRHGQVDFYTTQLITGHGCFKAYLHRFKHEADPSCDYCGGASVADAEHAFFECPLFRAEREAAEATTNRRLTPETIIGCMLETPSNWDAVTDMAATVMRELRRREQTRRTEGLR
nr:uncharacterized protein LOC121502779 [Drosophila kikkawai]